ncbi:MAG: hypothetical protein ACJ798_07515 [Phenylobacterium sp.]
MQAVQQILPLLIGVSLAALVMAVGMDSSLGELLALFRQPVRLAKAVLAVNVLVPIAAMVLVELFPLSPVARGGILLMAVSPVPPLVPGKQLKAGGSKTYGYALYTALALISVVVVPLSVSILSRFYDVEIPLSPTAVARTVATSVLAPLAFGLLLHRIAPGFSERLSPMIRKLAMLLVLVALVPILIAAWPALAALAGNGTLLAMALLAAIGLAAGHLLGGPDLSDRGALAVTAATRHPGIAIMIATAAGGDKRVTAAILAAVLVGLVVGIPYQMWLSRRRGAAPVAPSGAAPA